VAGFEALVRWRHPSRGLICPAEFIPLAENTGFIVPLGRWILREACLQLKAWRESLPDAGDAWVSVNLSTPQFDHPSLIEDVADALRDAGVPARCLVVELTEGVAMENPAAVRGQLMQLRAMGASVALDDFGTGQSSLAYLHQFPADKLKLDASFVRAMETRNDVRDIVGAVTTLAHQLGLVVIVEGVETEGQLARVRALGAEYVQGHFFSKPVDGGRAAEILATGFPPSLGMGGVAAPAPDRAPNDRAPMFAAPGTRRRVPRAVYVSAAVVSTLALAGVVARFTSPPPPQGGGSTRPALEHAATAPPTAVAPPPAPKASTVTSAAEWERAAAPAAKPVRSAVKPIEYTFTVVHKHAIRGCRGQFTVTSRGAAFVPDKREDRAEDAFDLPFSEFLSAVSGDELTVKTQERTYRFKAADAGGADKGPASLQQIADRIARLRPAAPAR
jgi:EAL domain-containing protein (putative c-di-GMP-specific phosphodiesterase class I)